MPPTSKRTPAAEVQTRSVKSARRIESVTRRDLESRTVEIKWYVELRLECGHYEYRYKGHPRFCSETDPPKAVACAGCTGRNLTQPELAITQRPTRRAAG